MKGSEKQITGKQRREATNKILRSTLRLLVLLRETLAVQQVPQTNPLHQSVFIHANLIGSLLPNDELIGPEELQNIRASVGSVQTVTDAETGVVEPAKPSLARLVRSAFVRNPDLIRNDPGLAR